MANTDEGKVGGGVVGGVGGGMVGGAGGWVVVLVGVYASSCLSFSIWLAIFSTSVVVGGVGGGG